MEPFRLLHLASDPFANSPDPDFFFESRRHRECRTQLELSIRMRRGLNVVVGDVGTGKTTLCRQLLRRLSEDPTTSVHLLLDPGFRSAGDALEAVLACLAPDATPPAREAAQKEAIRQALFQQAAKAGKTVVLILDEGQKIPPFFLEILREMLNFETNQHKLLQIVLFAQPEFEAVLREFPNVFDRVSFWYRLTPLSRREVGEMIDFRLKAAGASAGAEAFFSPLALGAIHRVTRGYPRRIVDLCHQCLLRLILEDQTRVGWRMVRGRAREGRFLRMGTRRFFPGWRLLSLMALSLLLAGLWGGLQMAGAPSNEPSAPRDAAALSPASPVSLATPGPADAGADPPHRLGGVALAKGETIGELADMIYGSARPDIIRAVLQANPGIQSPHRIKVGERIEFPALFPSSDPPAATRVEVERFADLQPAVEAFRRLRRERPDLPFRLLPSWHPAEGAGFHLLVDRAFADAGVARDWLYQLQAESPVPGTVYTAWPEGIVIFGEVAMAGGEAS